MRKRKARCVEPTTMKLINKVLRDIHTSYTADALLRCGGGRCANRVYASTVPTITTYSKLCVCKNKRVYSNFMIKDLPKKVARKRKIYLREKIWRYRITRTEEIRIARARAEKRSMKSRGPSAHSAQKTSAARSRRCDAPVYT